MVSRQHFSARGLTAIIGKIEDRRILWDQEGLSEEEMVDRVLDEGPQERGMGVFPCDSRWELDWDGIEGDQEATRKCPCS